MSAERLAQTATVASFRLGEWRVDPTLDPSFARGYFSMGQALLLAVDLGARPMTDDVSRQAGQAFDRAIELNPALGPAWAQRARLTPDPVQADEFYRRALELAPSYDENYIRYSDFLFSQGRRGEALELIDRARRIDPLSPALLWRKAELVLATRGDVAGMEQLLHEALAIKPDFPTALRDLAMSKFAWHGEFAEAVRLMERANAIDPESHGMDALAVELHLSMDDLPAAQAVLRDTPTPLALFSRETPISMALYQHDVKRAANLARTNLRETPFIRAFARSRASRHWPRGPAHMARSNARCSTRCVAKAKSRDEFE